MGSPTQHAQSRRQEVRGRAEDYLQIHTWFDESKAFLGDFRTGPYAIMPKHFPGGRNCLASPS